MGNISTILQKFEEIMCAAAFAEAGEHETARTLVGSGKNARKKVLLGVEESGLNEALVRSALNICRRMEARLEILHIFRKDADAPDKWRNLEGLTKAFRVKMQKMGIVYDHVLASDDDPGELIRRIQARRDIVCLVLGDEMTGMPGTKASGSLMEMLKKLQCPVVMCSGAAQAL
jgi:K+-sensing histidine kinase KdpD